VVIVDKTEVSEAKVKVRATYPEVEAKVTLKEVGESHTEAEVNNNEDMEAIAAVETIEVEEPIITITTINFIAVFLFCSDQKPTVSC